MKEHRKVTCKAGYGTGIKDFRFWSGSTLAPTHGEDCPACNGYGYYLESYYVPNDVVVVPIASDLSEYLEDK